MTITADTTAVQEIQQAAQQAVRAQQLDDGEIYAIKAGDRTELLETPGYRRNTEEEQAPRPSRVTRYITLRTATSLIDYLAANTATEGVHTPGVVEPDHLHGEGRLEVWADIEARKISAILDGNNGWRRHVARLELRHSREWEEWLQADGKLMPQVTFAQFVEDHLSSIGAPDGGVLLDICQTLVAKNKVDYRSSALLANGQRQFEFTETIEAKAGQKGNLTIPAELTLVLRPFVGSDPVAITARFRYRIDDGQLLIGVRLAEPEKALEDAFVAIVSGLQEALPTPILHGAY